VPPVATILNRTPRSPHSPDERYNNRFLTESASGERGARKVTQTPEQYVRAGKIARSLRDWIKANFRAGSSYREVADRIEEETVRRGGQPAFPCGIGVNAVTAHYAPQLDETKTILEGDLVKIDYGVHIDGYVADTAVTITENPQHQALLQTAERALQSAIDVVKKDRRIGEIGRAIEATARREGFKTINNLSGHTLQQYTVHAGKSIPNLYVPNQPVLKMEEVFAIEPFVTLGEAAGYVEEVPQTTIFSLMVRKRTGVQELDELVDRIWNSRKSLPFTPRWYASEYKEGRLPRLLEELERRRLLRSYPTLVEASRKPVAQFEHTMKFDDDGVTILT
jgi:methionyl aminopeptidase